MHAADDNGLFFLDLQLKIVEGKINVDLYSKPTTSFIYKLLSSYYPYKSILNVPKGITWRLQHICGSDEKYNQRSREYQKYLIGR